MKKSCQNKAGLGADDHIDLTQFAHHDLGWHANSFAGEIEHSNEEINSALDFMQTDEDYAWTHEHGRYLYEYLKAYPDRYEELAMRVKEGRFELGAGYSSPYTSFVTSELLVRQFVYGKKWIEELFPGYNSNVFYNTDIPGLGVQMPQILKKSSVDYLYASRSWDFKDYRANEFRNWRSLDGTEINTLFMHQYPVNLDGGFKSKVIEMTNDRIREYNVDIENANLGGTLPMICSHDMLKPSDFSSYFAQWNAYAAENNLPKMRYNTVQNALRGIFVEGTDFSKDGYTLVGEWPNKWFYENMASDNKTFMLQREADRYLRAAETLSVLRAIITGDFADYPAVELEEGWRAADHACHGYAPVECIDEFKKVYQNAYDIGLKLYNKQLDWLVSLINTDQAKGDLSFAVYNSLSWERDDVVVMDKPNGIGETFKIVDEDDKEIAFQMTADEQIVFIVEKVPSMGYKTLYIVDGETPVNTNAPMNKGDKWSSDFINKYYRLTPVAGGGALEAVIDRDNESKSLFSTEKFKIGELFRFQYDGMGAGEQLYIWQPHTPVSYLKDFAEWTCVESGPVRTVFETKADKTDDGPASLRITVYENIKKINFTLQLDNMSNVDKRQLRLMFPIGANDMFGSDDLIDQSKTTVTYEVPFGAVKVGDEVLEQYSKFNNQGNPNAVGWKKEGGAANKRSNQYEAKDDRNLAVRPREVQNWISSSDKDKNFSVTFSSYNLGWDYQDSTPSQNKKPVLQPVLLSHSRTCHGDGFIWNQPGEHIFNFSMTSGKAEDISGHKMGIQANNPLEAHVQKNKSDDAMLAETYSGFSTDKDNIIITAIKKAEDDNKNVVVRFYESEGSTSTGNVKVTFPGGSRINTAKEVNLIERDTGKVFIASNNVVTVPTSSWSIETAMLTLDDIESTPIATCEMKQRIPSGT